MWLWTRMDQAIQDIDDARERVDRAQITYSKGGGTRALNAAQKNLADCHARYRETVGGNVRDTR